MKPIAVNAFISTCKKSLHAEDPKVFHDIPNRKLSSSDWLAVVRQEGLAHEAGINRTYVSKLEKGVSYPGLEIIAKLATVLEVEPAELIRLPARQPPPSA
jgi:DNA-binding XRE family transcriptional regulator